MRYTITRSGRSSVWLERYLGVVEAARSSRVAPTKGESKDSPFLFIPGLFRGKGRPFGKDFGWLQGNTTKLKAKDAPLFRTASILPMRKPGAFRRILEEIL